MTPPATVLVHPDHSPDDPDACRLVQVAAAHPGEWPWRRLTGMPTKVPAQWSDLSAWQVQPLGDLGLVLRHPTVLTGHEVSR